MNVLLDALAYLREADNWSGSGGMLQLLVQQLLITVTALLAAMLVGLPIALWLGHLGRGGFLAINISNVGRAVPTFALLAIFVSGDPWGWTAGAFPGTGTVGPFGRAGISTLVALALFALPPLITNAYVAVREVPADVRESARGMGMSGWQQFRRAELPLALPLVMSGVRLALVQVWATATIAALVAGPGLGRVITDGFFRTDYGKGIAGAIVVAVVALLLELGAAGAQRLLDPLGRATRAGSGNGRARRGEGRVSSEAPTLEAAASSGG
ncbi:Putative osmoprotectant uptake system permease protein YehY [Nocardioides dokdonensis FR1436]|uniref:Putative osmoprotectant uptake system permease protein YehY n=1 Tax=Nocardioides dokdonensis FR1436 TaxID=1300347 RepID=A0A1A9GIL4_9ACTN|nr:ABC transporter permease [Nocardioides dokdonensis]ANH38108.1 Putative osmoprotectant uptake system permease protein YehY [Nocardioides dokdonensis FR1436]